MWNVFFSLNVVTANHGSAAQVALSPGGLLIQSKGKSYLTKKSTSEMLGLESQETRGKFFKQQSSFLVLSLNDLRKPDFIQYQAFRVSDKSAESEATSVNLKVNFKTDILIEAFERAKTTSELRIHVEVQLGDLKSSHTNASVKFVNTSAKKAIVTLSDRELTLGQLREMIDFVIPHLIIRYSLGPGPVDQKKYIEDLVPLHRCCEKIVQKIQKTHAPAEPDCMQLLDEYKAIMSEATEHADQIQRHNDLLASKLPLKERLLALIRQDDEANLKDILRNLAKYVDIEIYNYALREAAKGGFIKCLRYLLRAEFPDILVPDKSTSKIALHFAIEGEHIDCIMCLLKAVDRNGYYAPAEQLLFGEAPNRPIDAISTINVFIQLEIMQLIEDLLQSTVGYNTTKEQRKEIKPFIENYEDFSMLLKL